MEVMSNERTKLLILLCVYSTQICIQSKLALQAKAKDTGFVYRMYQINLNILTH